MDSATLIVGILTLAGVIINIIFQAVIKHKENLRLEQKYFSEIREKRDVSQRTMLQIASYLKNFSEKEYDKYSQFLDCKIFLDTHYLARNANFGVYVTLLNAMSKLNELVINLIKNRIDEEKIKPIKEDTELCIEYLQRYFDRVNEGFRYDVENITRYCDVLYNNEHLRMIEKRLNMHDGTVIKV